MHETKDINPLLIHADTAEEFRTALVEIIRLKTQDALSRSRVPNISARTLDMWLNRAAASKVFAAYITAIKIEKKETNNASSL
jgi:hypothetical protein